MVVILVIISIASDAEELTPQPAQIVRAAAERPDSSRRRPDGSARRFTQALLDLSAICCCPPVAAVLTTLVDRVLPLARGTYRPSVRTLASAMAGSPAITFPPTTLVRPCRSPSRAPFVLSRHARVSSPLFTTPSDRIRACWVSPCCMSVTRRFSGARHSFSAGSTAPSSCSAGPSLLAAHARDRRHGARSPRVPSTSRLHSDNLNTRSLKGERPMEVILLERVAKLGQMGEVVRVKDGYARNFLLPQGKALRATDEQPRPLRDDEGRSRSPQSRAEGRSRKDRQEARRKELHHPPAGRRKPVSFTARSPRATSPPARRRRLLRQPQPDRAERADQD